MPLTRNARREGPGQPATPRGRTVRAALAAITISLLLLVPSGIVRPQAARGATVPAAEGRQQAALTDRELDNLIAYTRLYGYVRYFYPGDAAASLDWDTFAVHTIQTVEDAPDAPALAARLQALFAPYAPTVRVFLTGQTSPALSDALQLPAGNTSISIRQWRYTMFANAAGQGQTERITVPVQNGEIPAGYADPRQPYRADLGGGVSALIPLALFDDEKGTLPHGKAPALPNEVGDSNHAVWLADIAIVWNALQHFYAYWDTLHVDWTAALRDALSSTARAENADAFYRTLRRLMALLDDGHVYTGQVGDPQPNFVLPLQWDLVENRLIVVYVHRSEVKGIRVGDEVTRINGRPVADILAAPENATGGTEAWRQFVALRELWWGTYNSTLRLEIHSRTGRTFTVRLHRRDTFNPLDWHLEPRPRSDVTQLAPGIMYLDMTRLTAGDLKKAMPKLTSARGIVVDGRGYPTSVVLSGLLGHFSTQPLRTGPFLLPIVSYPDHQKMSFQDVSYPIQPLRPYIKARLVFLINAHNAVSYAETVLTMVEGYHLGPLVGSHTAGTNGDIAELQLPGGYAVTWTGLRVLKHDGSQLMHVGVLPTIPAERTVAGVAAGHDEVLERGLTVLKAELNG